MDTNQSVRYGCHMNNTLFTVVHDLHMRKKKRIDEPTSRLLKSVCVCVIKAVIMSLPGREGLGGSFIFIIVLFLLVFIGPPLFCRLFMASAPVDPE